jgi:hypothetical protein
MQGWRLRYLIREAASGQSIIVRVGWDSSYNWVDMTRLLEQALEKLRSLPAAEQDSIASLVLDEIESEKKWDALFAKSSDKLKKLANEAWDEHEAGKSEELDTDKM